MTWSKITIKYKDNEETLDLLDMKSRLVFTYEGNAYKLDDPDLQILI